jgi:hypothetical protein
MKKNVWVWALSVLILSGCLRAEEPTETVRAVSAETAGVSAEAERATDADGEPGAGETQRTPETQSVQDTEAAEEDGNTTKSAEQQTDDVVQKTFALGRIQELYISQVNARTMSAPESGVVDLFSMDFSVAFVEEQITRYAFPEYTCLDGREMTDADRARIEENRNLPALSRTDDLNVTYGILTENAAVRSFPTAARLTKTGEDPEKSFDYFQESLLFMGEPVALLHTSLDGVYTFVQGMNYSGWVKTSCIRVCDSRLAQAVSTDAEFVVVTENFCDVCGTDNEKLLRMGTVLPLLEETDDSYIVPLFCDEQEADGCFAFSDGALQYYKAEQAPKDTSLLWVQEARLPRSCAHAGYLEYTQDNVCSLAERMLGSTYSWGDENAGFDCSSTVGSIYRCFGMILPRNSGILKYTGADVTDLTGMSADEKRAYITALPAGTILVLPGHAMMYLGEQTVSVSGQEQITPAMVHCVTGYVDVDGMQKDPYACVLTSIDIRSRGEESYLDLMTVCISFPG